MLLDVAERLLTKICQRGGENTIIFYTNGTFFSCNVPRYKDSIPAYKIVGVYNSMVSLEMLEADLAEYLREMHECT
jgi:hypothetical protein